MKKFESVRFGELEYDDKDLIFLPEGLIGLADLKNWLLLDMDGDIPLKWLHSVDRPDFCVPVTAAGFFTEDYEVQVPVLTRQQLGVGTSEEITVLIITTVSRGGSRITGNLLAPLLVGTKTRRGVQLPLQDESLSVHQEIDYFKFGLATGGKGAENVDSKHSSQIPGRVEVLGEDPTKVSI